LQNDST
jgi:hypothetical protein